jgi:hypothetical protein
MAETLMRRHNSGTGQVSRTHDGMEREPGPLSASELADLAGVTEAEVARMVGVGVLLPREGARPFRTTDVQKVRLAEACERAGCRSRA